MLKIIEESIAKKRHNEEFYHFFFSRECPLHMKSLCCQFLTSDSY
jgi:hypothetical protein